MDTPSMLDIPFTAVHVFSVIKYASSGDTVQNIPDIQRVQVSVNSNLYLCKIEVLLEAFKNLFF
jgi:hypothetical protein